MKDCFSSVISSPDLEKFYLVLDGLDECQDVEKLLEIMDGIENLGRVRILIVSRYSTTGALDGWFSKVTVIDIVSHNKAVLTAFIESTIANQVRRKKWAYGADLKDDILSSLNKKADGMYDHVPFL